MIQSNFLQNSFRGIFIPLLLLIFNGCNDKSSDKQTPQTVGEEHYVLPRVASTTITLEDCDTNFEHNTTMVDSSKGLFYVDLAEDLDQEMLLSLKISVSEQSNNHLFSYVLAQDFRKSSVVVHLLSTLVIERYALYGSKSDVVLARLNDEAKKVFRESINDDEVIDFRDFYVYTPQNGRDTRLINPYLYEQINNLELESYILADENISILLRSDKDADGLDLYEELLLGTDPFKHDTDGDGLSDKEELEIGTSPLLVDSDFDTISDYDEYYCGTNPTSSDSDHDYIPDNIELLNGTDPLNGDEDGNGVLDGLDGDPLFGLQWHLNSRGEILNNTKDIATVKGNDLGILDVYSSVLGYAQEYETIIQVIDTGVEMQHEDLDVSPYHSFNAVTKTTDPTAISSVSSRDKASPLVIGHGSAVAGIIGARANNAKGLRGVVPYAKIAGSNWLEEQSLYELERAWYSGQGAQDIVVSNNSWGAYIIDDFSYEEILELASKELRNGKGRIFTFAAGNEREKYGNSNLSYLANNRFAITVAALNHKDSYSFYSNPGSNVLVSAYGGERYYEAPTIATTLLMGQSYYEEELHNEKGALTSPLDTQRNYTVAMNGTSGATPMVSGAIALTLQACPQLTYRDVKWLIAHSATKVDIDNHEWRQNGAGLWHNINYGYGKINTKKMIDICRSRYFNLLEEEKSVSYEKVVNAPIPDNNTTIDVDINVDDDLIIEWVGLHIKSDHPYSGDLAIELISPNDTITKIITPNEIRFDAYSEGFRFSSHAFIGEKSQGKWRVVVRDEHEKDNGILQEIKLEIYGH